MPRTQKFKILSVPFDPKDPVKSSNARIKLENMVQDFCRAKTEVIPIQWLQSSAGTDGCFNTDLTVIISYFEEVRK